MCGCPYTMLNYSRKVHSMTLELDRIVLCSFILIMLHNKTVANHRCYIGDINHRFLGRHLDT